MIEFLWSLVGFDGLATFGGWGLSLFGAAAAGPIGIALWLWRHKWIALLAVAAVAAVAVAFVILGLKLTVATVRADLADAKAATAAQAAELRVEKTNRAAVAHDLTQCERANAATLRSIDEVKAWAGRRVAALEYQAERLAGVKQQTVTIIKKVDNARNDCAVPDPQRDFFDELRRQQGHDRERRAAPRARGDGGKNGIPGAAPGPVDLRPRAGSAPQGNHRSRRGRRLALDRRAAAMGAGPGRPARRAGRAVPRAG